MAALGMVPFSFQVSRLLVNSWRTTGNVYGLICELRTSCTGFPPACEASSKLWSLMSAGTSSARIE